MAEINPPDLLGEGLPPDLELEASQEAPDGVFTKSPDFLNLPPEIAMQLVEMIRQLAQTGQLPPELAQGMAPGPMPQGVPAQPQSPMPMAPMMPQGMAKGGNVEAQESMEELHHQINTAKAKLKEIEKGIKDSYAPQKKGSQGVAPNRPLAFAEGGEVPPDWWAGTPEEWAKLRARIAAEAGEDPTKLNPYLSYEPKDPAARGIPPGIHKHELEEGLSFEERAKARKNRAALRAELGLDYYGPDRVVREHPFKPETLSSFKDWAEKKNIQVKPWNNVNDMQYLYDHWAAENPDQYRGSATGPDLLSTQTLGDPIGTANMRAPEIPATIISDTVIPGQPKMGYIEPPMTRKEDLPGNYWGREAPYNPYLERVASAYPPHPDVDFLAEAFDRVRQSPKYQENLAKEAGEFIPGQVKAARAVAPYAQAAKRIVSHPATGAVSSALGPLLSHIPVAQQYSGDMGQAIKRAGLQRAMELRPEVFAEPHMGPPEPRVLLDQEGYVGKKLPGSWEKLPQDPFKKYADMPQAEWEDALRFGRGEVQRGKAYSPSPLEFWNPPVYFPKTKEDLVKAWPVGRGPVPEHLLPGR